MAIAQTFKSIVWLTKTSTVKDIDDATSSTACVIADSVGQWDDVLVDALARSIMPNDEGALVVTARTCPPRLAAYLQVVGAVTLGIDELRLTDSEIRAELTALVDEERYIEGLVELIDGWPVLGAGVLTALKQMHPHSISVRAPVVQECIDAVLRPLSTTHIDMLGQLAHLDLLSQRVMDTVQPGLALSLARAGIPMYQTATGDYRLTVSMKRWLELQHPLDADVAHTASVALEACGHPVAAARILLRAGSADQAAIVMVGMTPDLSDSVEPALLLNTLELLRPAATTEPRLLLRLAEAHSQLGNVTEKQICIEQAQAVTTGNGADAVRREADIESLMLRSINGDASDDLWTMVVAAEQNALGQAALLNRLAETKAVILCHRNDPRLLPEAIALSRRCADAWIAYGRYARAAWALRLQATAMLIPLGDLSGADVVARRAFELSIGTAWDRLRSLRISCLVIGMSGDKERSSELAEMAELADKLEVKWATATVHEAQMMLAGVHGTARDVESHFDQAWASLGDLRLHASGSVLAAEAAEAAARVGAVDMAKDLIGRFDDRSSEAPIAWLFARMAVSASQGNVTETDRLGDELDEIFGADGTTQWRPTLYRAIVRRLAATADCRDAAQRCRAALTEAGLPHLKSLLGDEESEGSGPPRPVFARGIGPAEPTARLAISVMGRFSVSADGHAVDVSSDRCATLLKTIAIGHGRVPTEVMIDRLWEDVSVEVGRRRLKNVMARAREMCGDVFIRRFDRIELDPSVQLDVVEFSKAVSHATEELATSSPNGVSLALAALSLYSGSLLPDDLYDEIVDRARSVLETRALALVDHVLAQSTNPMLASVLLDHVMRIDPNAVATLTSLALWSNEHGQTAIAHAAAEAAARESRQLGFSNDPRLDAILTAPSRRR